MTTGPQSKPTFATISWPLSTSNKSHLCHYRDLFETLTITIRTITVDAFATPWLTVPHDTFRSQLSTIIIRAATGAEIRAGMILCRNFSMSARPDFRLFG